MITSVLHSLVNPLSLSIASSSTPQLHVLDPLRPAAISIGGQESGAVDVPSTSASIPVCCGRPAHSAPTQL